MAEIEEEEGKWVKHYCSSHRILLVGEGDFSFSLSVANAFGSASNMVTTSLDTFGIESPPFIYPRCLISHFIYMWFPLLDREKCFFFLVLFISLSFGSFFIC